MKYPGNLKDINALLNYMQSACPGDLKDMNVIYFIISEKMSWRSQGHKCSMLLYLKKCPGDLKDINVLRHYSHLKNVLEIART